MRGLVIARGVRNGPSPDALVSRLRLAEAELRERLDIASLADSPNIASWREAYRRFGARPSEFRSSIEAIARRVLRNNELPSINALVDIGNIVSMSGVIPAGFHAFDRSEHDFALRYADGTETFIPIGSNAVENPEPGEIVLVEGSRVLTRRWTWRQAGHTATGAESTDVVLNIDALPPVTGRDVLLCQERAGKLIAEFCGGSAELKVLSRRTPCITLSA